MIKSKGINLLILFIASALMFYSWHSKEVSYISEPVSNAKAFEIKSIKSIQYQEIKESYGTADGRNVKSSTVTYKSPNLLRIENNGNIKTVDIYNQNKYIFYDEGENRIYVKECFPIDNPYITDVEKLMKKVFENENYESFGYEEVNDVRLKIVGIKYKSDGSRYMQKLWVGEVNGVSLPFREEYFIDNVVVSKSSYTYLRVNEEINNNTFNIESLPKAKVVNNGVIPKYVDEYSAAQKLLNFKIVLPEKLPEGYVPAEIAVIPPILMPKFYCIYYNSGGKRIYLNESLEIDEYNPNSLLNNIECEVKITDKNVIISWKQGKIYISISSSISEYEKTVAFAEDLAKGRLVKK